MLNVHNILLLLPLPMVAISEQECGSKSNVKPKKDSEMSSNSVRKEQLNSPKSTRNTLNKQINEHLNEFKRLTAFKFVRW